MSLSVIQYQFHQESLRKGVDTRFGLRYVPAMSRLPQHGREIAGKRFPYAPWARIVGSVEWLCPRCGKLNRDVMSPGKWRVTCKRSYCHITLVAGIRFGVLRPYRGCRPPLRPTDVFLECELFAWRSGEPATSLVEQVETGRSFPA